MGEEIDMELQFEDGLLCFEVDIDYEFDAPRYFELGREESTSEVQQAEVWFEIAGGYPTSHFIARWRIRNNVQQDNDSDVPMDACCSCEPSLGSVIFMGNAHDTLTQQDLPKDSEHIISKETVSRRPNFMKPTACQLARQSIVQRSNISRRFQKPLSVQVRNSEESSHSLLHPAKRLKVAGGHMCQVYGMTQQNELRHKTAEKKCGANCKSNLPKARLTIPKEPVLETARRAQNRSQSSKNSEGGIACRSTFKARPLNRKILESPELPFCQKSTPQLPEFQEFKLKTSERAFQHSLAAAASLVEQNHASTSTVKDFWTCCTKPQYYPFSDDMRGRRCIRKFKAVNHYEKELTYSTIKRFQQQNPLSELFNKLSLSSEVQKVNAHHSNFTESMHFATKNSKENVVDQKHFHEGRKFGYKQSSEDGNSLSNHCELTDVQIEPLLPPSSSIGLSNFWKSAGIYSHD